MKAYIPSSPVFFRRIRRAMAALAAALLLLALWLPAPLDVPANHAQTPNPAKAAWFLLWVQELVGYAKPLIWLVILGMAAFLGLPFWPGIPPAQQARWLPPDQRWVNLITLAVCGGMLLLTFSAMFCRGPNWTFAWPF